MIVDRYVKGTKPVEYLGLTKDLKMTQDISSSLDAHVSNLSGEGA